MKEKNVGNTDGIFMFESVENCVYDAVEFFYA
jgi:hypothetical protein